MTDWRHDAACVDAPVGDFYPAGGWDDDPYAEARWYCANCPVVTQCLATADTLEKGPATTHGMWGGLTPEQRIKRRKENAA